MTLKTFTKCHEKEKTDLRIFFGGGEVGGLPVRPIVKEQSKGQGFSVPSQVNKVQPALGILTIPLEGPLCEVLLIVLVCQCQCCHFPRPVGPPRASAGQQGDSDLRGNRQRSSCFL